MRRFLAVLAVVCPVLLGADKASRPKPAAASSSASVAQCFKVRRLLKTDSTHYWADWSNTCPFTIEAVYVMVGFRDRGNREMGNGVWPMYFVKPGAHRVTRFSAPIADFATIHVHRITTDSTIALVADPGPTEPRTAATPPAPGTVADTGLGKVLPPAPPAPAQRTEF